MIFSRKSGLASKSLKECDLFSLKKDLAIGFLVHQYELGPCFKGCLLKPKLKKVCRSGEKDMKSLFGTFLFLLLYVGAVVLYLSSFMPVDSVFFTSVILFLLFGVIMTYVAHHLAKKKSPLVIASALLSLVIGCTSAAIIIVSGKIIFGEIPLPQSVEIFLRFLLPLTTTIMSFWGVQTLLSAKARKNGASDGGDMSQGEPGKRYFLPDIDALEDGRIVDLARTGLFDGQIVIPLFLHKELKNLMDSSDENDKLKGRKAFESVRRLETFQKISPQIKDIIIPDGGDISEKIFRAAKTIEATIITSEFSPLRTESDQGLYIAIDSIANALRPPIPKGEFLSIKIQRLGKEPKQGIGYLDDGTMVVVNGGGDYLGKTVKTLVLSQKYSSSGKIVFCNVREEELEPASYGSP